MSETHGIEVFTVIVTSSFSVFRFPAASENAPAPMVTVPLTLLWGVGVNRAVYSVALIRLKSLISPPVAIRSAAEKSSDPSDRTAVTMAVAEVVSVEWVSLTLGGVVSVVEAWLCNVRTPSMTSVVVRVAEI